MTESFTTRHNGVDVKATLDTDTWKVIKVQYINPEWEVDCDLEAFTDYNDYLIDAVKKEIAAEQREYADHIEKESSYVRAI
jgi:hypothetical protein